MPPNHDKKTLFSPENIDQITGQTMCMHHLLVVSLLDARIQPKVVNKLLTLNAPREALPTALEIAYGNRDICLSLVMSFAACTIVTVRRHRRQSEPLIVQILPKFFVGTVIQINGQNCAYTTSGQQFLLGARERVYGVDGKQLYPQPS